MYEIDIRPKAQRQLKKLAKKQREIYLTIMVSIDSLVNFPEVVSIKTLKAHDYQYRLRVGDYRILFDADTRVEIIEVQEVKKRDESTY
jgi:mRNA-degrading endonuclease RelE of RelBE toxin-antitoxin system